MVRALRAPAVCERLDVSRTHLWRMVATGRFPQPIHLGPGARAWLESDIEEFLKGEANKRPTAAAK